MIKKLLSTTVGRIGTIVIVAVLMLVVKAVADRMVPMQVLHAVKSGQLQPAKDGSIMLPWYWRYESASGCVYVTTEKDGKISVLFPQIANGEARFAGELATEMDIDVGVTSPCNGAQLSCVTVLAPAIAADPRLGSPNVITVTGKISNGLYAVMCTQG